CMARRGHERAPRHSEARPARVALLGAAGVLLPLTPMVAFDYPGSPRLLYPSVAGLSMLVGAALEWGAARKRVPVESRAGVRGFVAGVGAVVLAGLGLAMLGVQEMYQWRARKDIELLDQLRTLAPDPVPGSVLVPALVATPAGSTRVFEEYFACAVN